MSLLKTRGNFIGLDIGTTGLRLVEVRAGAARPKLVTYGALALDSKVTQSDSAVDRQALVAAIKQLINESRATSRNVVAGLPSSKIFTSLISLPKMNEAELAKAVSYQAEQFVPVAISEVKLDWMVVGDNPDANQLDVLLVAVTSSYGEKLMSILEEAELEVEAFEPDAMALARALVAASPSATVILDVGTSATDLVMVYNGSPRIVRSIPIGAESFIKAVAQSLNLEAEQAAQFVYKFGLAASKLEGQVNKALKSNIDTLISEVDKSNKFFLAHYNTAKIDKLVLTGRPALIPEFPTNLANSVNLPVEIANAWGKIDVPTEIASKAAELSNTFAVACGLALRGIVDA